jgi:hypothetical protein
MSDDVRLEGGIFSDVVRSGQTVVRSQGSWSASVHAYLKLFEQRGLSFTPRYIKSTEDGREQLSFIEGEVAHYPLNRDVQSETALLSVAESIRKFHDVSTEIPLNDREVSSESHLAMPLDLDCIGHHDLGPWNFVFQGKTVAGIIDWDFAGPSNRLWDLCYAAHRFVPLSCPELSQRFGWPANVDRRARLATFCRAYGKPATPMSIVDFTLIRLAVEVAHIGQQIAVGNPAFARHAEEDHGSDYRADIAYLASHRESLIRS